MIMISWQRQFCKLGCIKSISLFQSLAIANFKEPWRGIQLMVTSLFMVSDWLRMCKKMGWDVESIEESNARVLGFKECLGQQRNDEPPWPAPTQWPKIGCKTCRLGTPAIPSLQTLETQLVVGAFAHFEADQGMSSELTCAYFCGGAPTSINQIC